MDQADIIPRIMSLCPMILAASFLLTGGLIIIRQQPILFRFNLYMWLLAIAFLPILGIIVYMYFASTPAPICQSFYLIITYPALAYGIWRGSSEFGVMAVREEALHAALIASLAKLGYPYEESVVGFVLPTISDTLQVRLKRGTAQLRMKSHDNFSTLKKIAQATQAYLQLDRESAVVWYGWIYVGVGLLNGLIALNFYTGWLMRGL